MNTMSRWILPGCSDSRRQMPCKSSYSVEFRVSKRAFLGFFVSKGASQSHLWYRETELWVGKQTFRKKKSCFLFSWAPLWNFREKLVGSNVKTHAAQLTVLNVGFCVIDAKQYTLSSQVHFLSLFCNNRSHEMQAFHNVRAQFRCCLWAQWMHCECLSASRNINFCFQLANFVLFWWNVNKPRALTCLSMKCCSVSGIRCSVLLKLSNFWLFISLIWNTQQYFPSAK